MISIPQAVRAAWLLQDQAHELVANKTIPLAPSKGIASQMVLGAKLALSATTVSIVFGLVALAAFWRHRTVLNNFWNRVVMQFQLQLLILNVVCVVSLVPLARGKPAGLENGNPGCVAQGFLIEWLALSGCFLNVYLVAAMYLQLVAKMKARSFASFERASTLVVWMLPLAFASLPLGGVLGRYASSGIWCWVEPQTPQRLVLLYGWVWVLVLVMGIACILILRHLHTSLKGLPRTLRSHLVARMGVYPLFFVVVWSPVSVARMYTLARPDRDDVVYSGWIFALQVVLLQLTGSVNALIFVTCNRGKLCNAKKRNNVHAGAGRRSRNIDHTYSRASLGLSEHNLGSGPPSNQTLLLSPSSHTGSSLHVSDTRPSALQSTGGTGSSHWSYQPPRAAMASGREFGYRPERLATVASETGPASASPSAAATLILGESSRGRLSSRGSAVSTGPVTT